MSGYAKRFDQKKNIFFLIKDDEFLNKYNEMWDKVSNSIKIRFDSEPVYNKKYSRCKKNLMKLKSTYI